MKRSYPRTRTHRRLEWRFSIEKRNLPNILGCVRNSRPTTIGAEQKANNAAHSPLLVRCSSAYLSNGQPTHDERAAQRMENDGLAISSQSRFNLIHFMIMPCVRGKTIWRRQLCKIVCALAVRIERDMSLAITRPPARLPLMPYHGHMLAFCHSCSDMNARQHD